MRSVLGNCVCNRNAWVIAGCLIFSAAQWIWTRRAGLKVSTAEGRAYLKYCVGLFIASFPGGMLAGLSFLTESVVPLWLGAGLIALMWTIVERLPVMIAWWAIVQRALERASVP